MFLFGYYTYTKYIRFCYNNTGIIEMIIFLPRISSFLFCQCWCNKNERTWHECIIINNYHDSWINIQIYQGHYLVSIDNLIYTVSGIFWYVFSVFLMLSFINIQPFKTLTTGYLSTDLTFFFLLCLSYIAIIGRIQVAIYNNTPFYTFNCHFIDICPNSIHH